VVWIGAGIYVADDAFGTERAGVVARTPSFLATGFFAAALLEAAFLVVFFMRRTLQQPANGRQ
jgi:F0F1-type ATP synthase membrane subunit c/vacuolar-type H+-ATPase subunit K